MGATVLADILITVMMSWALYRMKTGFAGCACPIGLTALDLADVQSQNRFHDHGLDGLHHQFRLSGEVSSSSTLINDPILT